MDDRLVNRNLAMESLWVINPTWRSWSSQKPSVAWCRATAAAKRTQGSLAGHRVKPRNYRIAGADALRGAEGSTVAPKPGLAFADRRGRGSEARRAYGIPQEPGRPCRLRRDTTGRGNPETNPRLRAGALPARRAKHERNDGTAERGNERRGTDGRESEFAIVPVKRGNSPKRTLRR
jgi:hypothetical protein